MIAKSDNPEITFVLLGDGAGIMIDGILNVCPNDKKIKIVFEVSDPFKKEDLNGAYLVIDVNGKIQYRAIYDGKTDIAVSTLNGTVTLAVSSGGIKKVWRCEPLTVQHLENNLVAILPRDIESEKKIANICVELAEIKQRLGKEESKTDAFDARLTEIMNGYDLV